MIRIEAGGRMVVKKRRYRDLEHRLAELKMRLDGSLTLIDYADAASNLIHLE